MFGIMGMCYVVLLKKDLWVATQGLLVRAEANGGALKPGSFDTQADMKAAQETILEMARNLQVVRAALEKVGPKKSMFSMNILAAKWPSEGAVQGTASSAISVGAPKGAQFGTTEVIYLAVKQESPERAVALARALTESLEHSLQEVRKSRAVGVISELEHARDIAQKKLADATAQIQVIERETGADLSDLRGMTDSNSGGSSSRLQLDALKAEIRAAEHQHQLLLTDLNLLRETLEKPMQLMVAPSNLLNSQPGLKRLREGLADSQLSLSFLQGRYSDSHPQVIAAMNARKQIETKLQRELVLSVQSVQNDVEISSKRIDKLKNDHNVLSNRLDKLADVRVKYGNLVADLRTSATLLQDAERELARAQARSEAALSTSLLTRLGEPVLGEKPVGPGRTTILGGATFLGLFFGLGIVFLLTPMDTGARFGRRADDSAPGRGRRMSDRVSLVDENRTQGNTPSELPASQPPAKSATPVAAAVIEPASRANEASGINDNSGTSTLNTPADAATPSRLQMRAVNATAQSTDRRKKAREEPSRTFWSS